MAQTLKTSSRQGFHRLWASHHPKLRRLWGRPCFWVDWFIHWRSMETIQKLDEIGRNLHQVDISLNLGLQFAGSQDERIVELRTPAMPFGLEAFMAVSWRVCVGSTGLNRVGIIGNATEGRIGHEAGGQIAWLLVFLTSCFLLLAACNNFLPLAAGNFSSDALPLLQAGSAD